MHLSECLHTARVAEETPFPWNLGFCGASTAENTAGKTGGLRGGKCADIHTMHGQQWVNARILHHSVAKSASTFPRLPMKALTKNNRTQLSHTFQVTPVYCWVTPLTQTQVFLQNLATFYYCSLQVYNFKSFYQLTYSRLVMQGISTVHGEHLFIF